MKLLKRSSLFLSLTVLSVLCGSYSAQAETASTSSDVVTPAATFITETPAIEATTLGNQAIASSNAPDVVTEGVTDANQAIAPLEATATITTVPSATLDSLTAQQVLASHTPGHAASSATDTAATTAPETTETVVEDTNFSTESTTAADLTPTAEPANSTAELAPETAEQPQVAQVPTSPILTRPPSNNYIGAGVNFGDDTSFAVVSKFALTQFSSYGLSLRPAVLFGDSVGFRIPITIESRFNTDSEEVNRFAPYAGLGVAIDTEDDDEDDDDGDDDSNVDFMLTAGSDFLLTNRVTATAGVNLLFSDDTDLELLLGIGYNF